MEIFKEIAGYENYSVSNWGRVKRNKDDMILTNHETSKGYLRVDLFKGGVKKHYKVHRLVAQAFIDNPQKKPQINHKDGNKKNNSVTNLEWVTDAENKEHKRRMDSGDISL